MKILAIGNSGFIGTFLTKKLYEEGHEIAGLDKNMPSMKENLSYFARGSILNPEDIMKAAEGVDLIINLAAAHHDFGVSRDEFFEVNVKGTQNILDCAAKLSIKKFIFYSSVAVYGTNKDFSSEDTMLKPANDYGESKLAAEQAINSWANQDANRQVIIIRPTVVFGPNNYANMYNLINQIYKKKFIFVGKGLNIKSVAYVENLIDATIFLLERLKPGVEIYNYSDYPHSTSSQIVKMITQYLQCGLPKLRIPLRAAAALASIFDFLGKLTGYNFPITANRIKKFNTATLHNSDKIKQLGFKPNVDLQEGFKRMVEWYLRDKNV